MSIGQQTDRDEFNAYIDKRWGDNLNGTSLEDALSEFRAYQKELFTARKKIEEALLPSNGKPQPMDDSRMEALFRRRDSELAKEGIGE